LAQGACAIALRLWRSNDAKVFSFVGRFPATDAPETVTEEGEKDEDHRRGCGVDTVPR
jgi:hypothetical protein